MLPLISALMPTRDRRQYIPGAVSCFLNQTWPNKELIVLDSGDDPVGDLMPPTPAVRYVRLKDKPTIGAARNIACSLARGEFFVHFDDDDISHPLRLKEQYKLLTSFQRGLVGYRSMVFIDEEERKAYLYPGDAGYALGTSFFYRRQTWRAHHFPDKQVHEDGDFINAVRGGALSVPAGDRMVARIHSKNTSCKRGFLSSWVPQNYEYARGLMP